MQAFCNTHSDFHTEKTDQNIFYISEAVCYPKVAQYSQHFHHTLTPLLQLIKLEAA